MTYNLVLGKTFLLLMSSEISWQILDKLLKRDILDVEYLLTLNLVIMVFVVS